MDKVEEVNTYKPKFKDCSVSDDRQWVFLEFDYFISSNEKLAGIYFGDMLLEDEDVKVFSMKCQPLKILIPFTEKYREIPTITLKVKEL